jgi:hypothetical protein
MHPRRKLLIAGLVLLLAAAVVAFVVMRQSSKPPQAMRLLPEGEFLLYANLKVLHFFDSKPSNSVQLDPEYQTFVDQTGIRFERDLDEVAMSRRDPGNGADVESSEIFAGHFDLNRLRNYLQKLAITTEKYADKTVFSILHEGHTVRVCILTDNQVAVTNMASAEPIHSMIDKFRNAALAAQGPYLAEHYYAYVPFTSAAWLVYRVPSQAGAAQLPGGLNFDFLQNTTGVISLRYSGALQLRADVFAESEAEAKDVAESAHNFLSLYRSIAQSVGTRGSDKDVKKAFDSIQIDQKENRAIFTATIPPAFLKKIASDAQSGSQTGNQGPDWPTPGKRP